MMYERRSQFIRAMKQADNDFSAFGQCVVQPEMNKDRDGILYRTWHLRDVAWCENAELEVDTVHRAWKLEARQLVKLFPKTVADVVRKAAEKEPYREFKCRHIVMPRLTMTMSRPMRRAASCRSSRSTSTRKTTRSSKRRRSRRTTM
jgi:hypothetical protein